MIKRALSIQECGVELRLCRIVDILNNNALLRHSLRSLGLQCLLDSAGLHLLHVLVLKRFYENIAFLRRQVLLEVSLAN